MKHLIQWSKSHIYTNLQWVAITIAIYSLLFAVTIDCYKEPYDWIKLPVKILFSIQKNFISLKELLKTNENQEIEPVYIFVLDVSGSIIKNKGTNIEIGKPASYDDDIMLLQQKDYIANNSGLIVKADSIKAYQAAKVLLYRMLTELNNPVNSNKNRFAVWTIGDHAKRIFPDSSESFINELNGKAFAKANQNFIKQAISKTESINPSESPDLNTDFKELFDDIWEEYPGINGNTPLVLILLSDCIHDVSERNKGKKMKIEKNWKELKEKIQHLYHIDITINLLLISTKGSIEKILNEEKQLYTALDENLEKFLIKYKTINENIDKSFIYQNKKICDNSIIFYYESQSYMKNYFDIYSLEDKREIEILIATEWDNVQPYDDFFIEWSIFASNGVDIRNKGRVSKYNSFKGVLNKNQKIRFFYEDRPLSKDIPLKVIDHKNRKVYYTNIMFIKKIPLLIAITMTFFILATFVLSILITIACLSFMLNFFFRAKISEYNTSLTDTSCFDQGMPNFNFSNSYNTNCSKEDRSNDNHFDFFNNEKKLIPIFNEYETIKAQNHTIDNPYQIRIIGKWNWEHHIIEFSPEGIVNKYYKNRGIQDEVEMGEYFFHQDTNCFTVLYHINDVHEKRYECTFSDNNNKLFIRDLNSDKKQKDKTYTRIRNSDHSFF